MSNCKQVWASAASLSNYCWLAQRMSTGHVNVYSKTVLPMLSGSVPTDWTLSELLRVMSFGAVKEETITLNCAVTLCGWVNRIPSTPLHISLYAISSLDSKAAALKVVVSTTESLDFISSSRMCPSEPDVHRTPGWTTVSVCTSPWWASAEQRSAPVETEYFSTRPLNV